MALIKINNFRADVPDPLASARSSQNQPPVDGGLAAEPEQFAPEKLPPKIPFVKPQLGSDGSTLVAAYHAEAPYSLRRILIE